MIYNIPYRKQYQRFDIDENGIITELGWEHDEDFEAA